MKKITITLLAVVCLLQPLLPQVKLPRLIRDSMILQRDQPIRIWGWAAAGEKIKIRFNKAGYSAKANNRGEWKLQLPAMKAGGPYTMQIDASNHLTLKEILLGDVWICAGQSNMVHQMELHSVRYGREIQEASFPQIRHFWVPNNANMQAPQADLPGGYWKWANPEDVKAFSAVAYFFAKKTFEKYHVPIGLINASWGGTPIEAWLSGDAVKEFPAVLKTMEQNRDTAFTNEINRKAFASMRSQKPGTDQGLEENWFSDTYLPRGWRNIYIPGYWEDQGIRNLDGVVWYRRQIDLPASVANAPAKVFLGRIVDADVLYINGQQAGTTGYMYPQRRYAVPAGALHPGKNLFVIRVTNNSGKGGFVPDKPYQLVAGKDTIALSGEWQYKVGRVNTPSMEATNGIAAQNQPAALYNAMIAPIEQYTCKGFLWYQGESNTGRFSEYTRLQNALIMDWRRKWQAPEAPFLYVQLPGFMEMNYLPSESQWAMFREAQLRSLEMPSTAMVVSIDLGEWNDIHPDRKKEVGERLALAAGALAYGESRVGSSGPLFQSAFVQGQEIKISFTHTGNGLVAIDGEPLGEFAIAGADRKFVWANARIEQQSVVVWNAAVPTPLYVRYAWSDFPVNPNLFNKEGLPASPFRTDK